MNNLLKLFSSISLIFLFGFFLLLGCSDQGDPPSSNVSDTLVTWNAQVWPALESECSICHDAGLSSGGLNLSDTVQLLDSLSSSGNPYVLVNQPDDSELYWRINNMNGFGLMPPPPNPPLTDQQKTLIKNWILQGAQL